MRVMGIGDGFGAGVAFVEDGTVRFAVSEERLSRIKNHSGYYHGFPERSVEAGLSALGWTPGSIDRIAISNFAFPPLPLRLLALSRRQPLPSKELLDQHEFSKTLNTHLYSLFSERPAGSALGKGSVSIYRHALARKLKARFGLAAPIEFVDHHRCHAASAYFTQAEDDCLVVTKDCHGDGLSGSVSLAKDGTLRRIATFRATDSLGSFYAAVTNHLGFHHHRHEGKVTGLAAYGDPRVAEADVARMISYDPSSHRLTSRLGRNQFVSIARIGSFFSKPYSREDIAAAAQRHLEHIILEIVRGFLAETGKRKVLLAGGVFGNVKLNQRINQLPGVDYLFVHPGMGDEGLPVGAALAASAARGVFRLARIANVFWGPTYGEQEMERVLAGSGFRYERFDDVEAKTGALLAQGKIVARCDGAVEYGPRALGNRSILFHAGDPTVNDWLNKSLQRSEFMPFAPATLRERAAACYRELESAAYAAEFMTVCFDCAPEFTAQCPAVVHVDGTARPQLVDAHGNPGFHKILREYEARTGIATLINTSFNIHEEPIVCSPADAMRAFATAALDYLALGPFIVWRDGGGPDRAEPGR
jgi:carbamoyltransferase